MMLFTSHTSNANPIYALDEITKPAVNQHGLYSTRRSNANRTALVSLHQHAGGKEGETSPTSWTYAQLHEESLRLAHRLSAQGVAPGHRIATILFNQIEWALVFWAAAHLGCQFIGIDYRAVNHKDHAWDLLKGVPCDVIIASNNKLALAVDNALGQDKNTIKHRFVVEEPQTPGWRALAKHSQDATGDLTKDIVSPSRPDDTAVIFFTSGTTGSSKACPHSAVTLYSVARGLSKAHSIDHESSICQHLPGFHIFSVVYSLTAWLHGASLVFPNPTFDADCTIRAIQQSRNVILPCVPLMIQAIARSPIRPHKFETLQTVTIGGSTVYPEVVELCASLGAKRIAAGYGMSESLVVATNNQSAEDAIKGGDEVCLGTAVSGGCIRICPPGSCALLSRGEIGEVHLGGLTVFSGYLGMEHESCYREGGVNFIVSGDQGYMDNQGQLYVLGRYKFDWLPDIRPNQSTSAKAEQEKSVSNPASVEMLEVLSRTDLGFVWYPSLTESNTTLKLNTTWDDAQMHASEVSQAMKGFLSATAWLSRPENWEQPARECKFEMEDEIIDVGPEKCYRR
ncbi:hypothetical protein MYU51_011841 [Penicillium brevicompactum]